MFDKRQEVFISYNVDSVSSVLKKFFFSLDLELLWNGIYSSFILEIIVFQIKRTHILLLTLKCDVRF